MKRIFFVAVLLVGGCSVPQPLIDALREFDKTAVTEYEEMVNEKYAGNGEVEKFQLENRLKNVDAFRRAVDKYDDRKDDE